MAETYKHVTIDEGQEGVKRLILNRPPLNILNIEMMEEMVDALEGFSSDKGAKILVLMAEGKAFSAGVDVEDHMGDKAAPMIRIFHRIFELLETFECPTVALVGGAALGGGCEVATFCDMILASEKAKFGQPEIKVGVLAPLAVIRFPQLVGLAKTYDLLLTGESLGASEAREI